MRRDRADRDADLLRESSRDKCYFPLSTLHFALREKAQPSVHLHGDIIFKLVQFSSFRTMRLLAEEAAKVS